MIRVVACVYERRPCPVKSHSKSCYPTNMSCLNMNATEMYHLNLISTTAAVPNSTRLSCFTRISNPTIHFGNYEQ